MLSAYFLAPLRSYGDGGVRGGVDSYNRNMVPFQLKGVVECPPDYVLLQSELGTKVCSKEFSAAAARTCPGGTELNVDIKMIGLGDSLCKGIHINAPTLACVLVPDPYAVEREINQNTCDGLHIAPSVKKCYEGFVMSNNGQCVSIEEYQPEYRCDRGLLTRNPKTQAYECFVDLHKENGTPSGDLMSVCPPGYTITVDEDDLHCIRMVEHESHDEECAHGNIKRDGICYRIDQVAPEATNRTHSDINVVPAEPHCSLGQVTLRPNGEFVCVFHIEGELDATSKLICPPKYTNNGDGSCFKIAKGDIKLSCQPGFQLQDFNIPQLSRYLWKPLPYCAKIVEMDVLFSCMHVGTPDDVSVSGNTSFSWTLDNDVCTGSLTREPSLKCPELDMNLSVVGTPKADVSSGMCSYYSTHITRDNIMLELDREQSLNEIVEEAKISNQQSLFDTMPVIVSVPVPEDSALDDDAEVTNDTSSDSVDAS